MMHDSDTRRMLEYRRHRVPDATYFFTPVPANRRSDLLVREIAALRAAIVRTRRLNPFQHDKCMPSRGQLWG
jgi:putative transposase